MTDRNRQDFFPPLPPSSNRDQDTQWLQAQTISAQKIISGEIQVGIEISSSNFVSSSTGWQIDGAGNAEFNNVTVRGDLVSGNWDGSDPPNLSGEDAGATAGFALDSSEGSAQFEGNIFLGGLFSVGSDGSIEVAGDGSQKTVLKYFGGFGGIQFHGASGDDPGFIYAINSEEMQIAAPVDDQTTHDLAMVRLQSENALGFTASWSVSREGASGHNKWIDISDSGVRIEDGSASTPVLSFISDTDTGMFRENANTIGFATGGSQRWLIGSTGVLTPNVPGTPWMPSSAGSASTPSYSFQNDRDTGPYLGADGVYSIAAAGSQVANFRDGGSSSSLSLLDGLTDVGNHETLRLNRGTGTTLQFVGYFSSWAEGKTDILSLVDSPRFPGLDIIDNIRAIDFERKSTKEREWGFLLDEFKELDDNLRYLTTKGDRWGYSPDENAIAALLLEGVKDLRSKVKRLEKRIIQLEAALEGSVA